MFSTSAVDYRTLTLWVFGFPVFSLNLSAVQELLRWQQLCFLTGNINSFSHSRWHHFPFCLTTTIMVKAYLENSLMEQLFSLHYASKAFSNLGKRNAHSHKNIAAQVSREPYTCLTYYPTNTTNRPVFYNSNQIPKMFIISFQSCLTRVTCSGFPIMAEIPKLLHISGVR